MTFRIVRWLHRRGVSRAKFHGTWLHRLLGDRLFHRELWALQGDSVARGWLIGCMVATSPLFGLHLLLGLPLALLCRGNVMVVTGLILTTNPVTAGVFYPFAYVVGCHLLQRSAGELRLTKEALRQASGPLLLGCTVIGLLSGLTGYLLIRKFWKRKERTAASMACPGRDPRLGTGS